MSLTPTMVRDIPEDPASILLTPKRQIIISDQGTAAAGLFSYTHSLLVDAIRQQAYAGATVSFRYQVMKLVCWGQSGTGTRIQMEDSSSNIEVSDLGSYAFRPKVGLTYSPLIQSVHYEGTTGDIVKIESGADSDALEFRTSVRIWASAK